MICGIVCYGVLCINPEEAMYTDLQHLVWSMEPMFMVVLCHPEDYIHMRSNF